MRPQDDTFTDGYIATTGADCMIRTIELNEKTIKLQIWDTAGARQVGGGTPQHARAHGIIVVYDVTNKTSFDNVKGWLEEIKKHAKEGVKTLLVGNKADHEEGGWLQQRKVTQAMGSELASQEGILFLETSAKSGTFVDVAFMMMAHNLMTGS